MENLTAIQEQLSLHRKEREATTIDLLIAKEQVAKQQEQLSKLSVNAEEYKKLATTLKKSEDTLNQRYKTIRELDLKGLQLKEPFGIIDPIKQVSALDDAFPILLFPLRLETRFKKNESDINQLWLRVYPDDCQINSKQVLITETELENTKAFWREKWAATGDETAIEIAERGAWRSLVNSHGSGRATWLVEQFLIDTTLTALQKEAISTYWKAIWTKNIDETIINNAFTTLKTALANDEIAEKIKVQYNPATAQTSWTQAPKAITLPDRFVVICYNGTSKRTIFFENPVKDNLAVGPDPSLAVSEQLKAEDGDLKINENLKWMVDFESAIKVGMGIKIDLSLSESRGGFDKIVVVGIRVSSNEKDSKVLVEKLFTDHFHSSHGLSLLKQGTPTNNIEDEESGYTWSENADETFDAVFKQAINAVSEDANKTDGQKLAESLGIDAKVFQKVSNANGHDQAEAIAMNTALFPATMGYFMEEMMHPLFSDEDIENTRDFFSNYVSGRGAIPAVRIGKQPYGILPTTAFSRLNFDRQRDDAHIFDRIVASSNTYLSRLHGLLKHIDTTWENLLPNVSYVGKAGEDSHQILLDVIGLHPNSVEFHQRYAESLAHLYNRLNIQFRSPFIFSLFGEDPILRFYNNLKGRGKRILDELGLKLGDTNLPILEKFFLSSPTLLNGPLIDSIPLSELKKLGEHPEGFTDYIKWLATTDPEKIRTQDFGTQKIPNAILYLLTRHALMLAQADAGSKVLLKTQTINSKKAFHDADFIHIDKGSQTKTKLEYLYSNFQFGDTNKLLIDYIYQPEIIKNEQAARVLKETIEALTKLENTPTSRLERLLVEHLDCCNYRIDAWKTGLINYKLHEQRQINAQDNKPTEGLYLGGYGWLLDVRPKNKTLHDITLNEDLKKVFRNESENLQSDDSNLGFIHAPSLNQAATAAILRNAYDSYADNSGKPNPYAINLSSERIRAANSILEGIRNGQSLSALLGYQFERGLHDKHHLGKGEVDKFIYPLRKKFPLVADNLNETLTNEAISIESIEANNVIDGIKFIKYLQENLSVSDYPYTFNDLPVATNAEKVAIKEEVDKLFDSHDVISDMVMAEQVYQVVQGNFDRAAGNADAFSKGNYPPEIEVINTPRTGVTLTQKVTIHFDSATGFASPFTTIGMTPRASAEPSINKWLSEILPSPDKVICFVEFSTTKEKQGEVYVDKYEPPIKISQEDLGFQPLDFVYLLNFDTQQAMTLLDDKIMDYVRYQITNNANTKLKIKYTEKDETDNANVSFFELGALIKSLRKILVGSKHISPTDFSLSKGSIDVPINYDIAELKARIVKLTTDLAQILVNLDTLSTSGSAFDTFVKEVSKLLLTISNYGFSQAGIGFIHDGIYAIYQQIIGKFITIKQRWETKNIDFAIEIGLYSTSANDTEKFEHLRKAERIISTEFISLTSTSPSDFKAEIDKIKTTNLDSFDKLLLKFDNLINPTFGKLTDYFDAIDDILPKIAKHDLIPFDIKDSKNDIEKEKKQANSLTNDIKLNLENLKTEIDSKIKSAEFLLQKEAISGDQNEQIKLLIDASKILLGEDSLLLPHFTLPNKDEFKNTFETSNDLLAYLETKENKQFPVEEWLSSIARVKEKMLHWENISVLAEGLNNNLSLDLKPLQFPYKAATLPDGSDKDRWLAMKFRDKEEDYLINSDKLLYTTHFAQNAFDVATTSKPQCGIIVDEWSEVIPAEKETTGISFHYDQPNSEPPQVMLLVVPPVFTGKWQWENIVDALDETLDMAKKRAVEPVHIEATSYAQFLPTTMMAVTLYWLTISTNLAMNKMIYEKI